MTDNTARALAEAGRSLQTAAQSHKQAASYHRRRLHEVMQSLTELKRECAALGINLDLTNTDPEGGNSVRTNSP